MPAAFVEHRPRGTDLKAETKHYTFVVNGTDSSRYSTQAAAKNAACSSGNGLAHVARVRHLQDRSRPDNPVAKHAFALIALLLLPLTVSAFDSGPAPAGGAVSVATSAINDAGHKCGKVKSAKRLDDGSVRAVCSNGESFRIFTVNANIIAMKCSAAERMGVKGC